jgi:flagellar protein FliO/FliZ
MISAVDAVVYPLSRPVRALVAALASAMPVWAAAAAPSAAAPLSRPFAAPEAAGAPPAPGIGGLGEVTLALAIVLAAIFALAWLVRYLRGTSARTAAVLDVLAEVRLGPKERAVLLKVGTTQLLLGVAPGRVNALHVLTDPVATPPGAEPAELARPSFRSLLMKSLGRL